MEKLKEQYNNVKKIIIECNNSYSVLKGSDNLKHDYFFLPEEIPMNISFLNYECVFKDFVNFSYQVLIERDQKNLQYLKKISEIYRPEGELDSEFKKIIISLRTRYFHYVTSKKKHDTKTIEKCKKWFFFIINVENPTKEEEYKKCSKKIIEELCSYLKGVSLILKEIEISDNDERKEMILEQWKKGQESYIPKYEMITVLEDLKNTYEIEIENDKFFSKYKSEIDNSMSVCKKKEKLYEVIEGIVLSEYVNLSVTGKVVSKKYDLKKDRLVKAMIWIKQLEKKEQNLGKEDIFKRFEEEYLGEL